MDIINVTKSSMPDYENFCDEIKDIWESCCLTNNGMKLQKLEKELCNKLNAKNISLFVNGHSALEALIASFHFDKGSEIITTPYTFISTTNAIIRNSLIPVFCDISPDDFNIDPKKIESLITKKTVAILAVHVYGIPCKCDEIEDLARKHNIKVIYDAAHAFNVFYNSKSIVNYGDGSILSFHATKVFNTIEGGCVVCNNSKIKEFLESYKDFGLYQSGENGGIVGPNFKMKEFQAAMGLCNLKRVDNDILKRKAIYEEYRKGLLGLDIKIINPSVGVTWNYAYFPIVLIDSKKSRDQLKDLLFKYGYNSRRYFYPITSMFDSIVGCSKLTPIAEKISKSVLCLPIYPSLDLKHVKKICDLIKEYLNGD